MRAFCNNNSKFAAGRISGGVFAAVSAVITLVLSGCAEPPAIKLRAPYPTERSVVVVPLLNHCPNTEFDTIVATDVMVDELMRIDGLKVFPTNMALKLLLERGRTHAESMSEAAEVAHMLGADGVLVGSISEYKPYPPQKLAMTLQLHWLRADIGYDPDDPVGLSRRPSIGQPTRAPGSGHGSQVQMVFDAATDECVRRVRLFAASRTGQDSPYGWRRSLVDSEAFMHFASCEAILKLLSMELDRITMPVQNKR